MMPRVVEVTPLPQYRLHVEFDDGVAGTIDLSDELDGDELLIMKESDIMGVLA